MASDSLSSIYIGDIYIYLHTYLHPPTILTTHSTHTNTHATNAFTRTHKHTCLFHFHHAWKLLTTSGHCDGCCLRLACAYLLPVLPPTGTRQAGPVSTWTSRAGVLSSSFLSLTCSTCPIFSSLHCGFDWVECQSLPGTEPRTATEKPISCGPEPPWAQLGACQFWKDHQGNRPHRWPPPVTSAIESHGMSQHMACSVHVSFLLLKILDILGIPGLSETETGRTSETLKRYQLTEPRIGVWALPFPISFWLDITIAP